MNTKDKKTESRKETVVSLVKLSLLKKGLVMGISFAILVLLIGSASANCIGDVTGTVFGCGATVTESCTFNANMNCPLQTTHGLIVGADDITINGYNSTTTTYYYISGVNNGNCTVANGPRAGIFNHGAAANTYDNVTIKNLEVKHFCTGIRIFSDFAAHPQELPVENNTIYNCTVHSNGNTSFDSPTTTQGIDIYGANNTLITKCRVYNNTGNVAQGCEDGGHGIRLYGYACPPLPTDPQGRHNITDNTIYGNRMSGIYAKHGAQYCNVSYNDVYENGELVSSDYFGGGIRLECIGTSNWNVFNNTITNNYGPGIFVRGDSNVITNNTVRNNCNASSVSSTVAVGAGYGIYLNEDGSGNNVSSNEFCYNEHYDVGESPLCTGNSGVCNTCDTNNAASIICSNSCASMPDLVISDVWVNWTEGSGSDCKIRYNVTNIGNANAPLGHTATLYVDGVEKDTDTVPVQLASGDSYEGYFATYTWDYSSDGYNVTVYADTNKVVNESDECHNSLEDKLICGDVTEDDWILAGDGSLVYYVAGHAIGTDALSSVWAADVTGDGWILAGDGSLVYYVAGHVIPAGDLSCCCK